MTAEVSKVVSYAVVGTPGGAEVSKVNFYAVLTPTPPGLTDQTHTVRVWPYSLDGHDFYVVRLGTEETLVYDLSTGQWAHWASPGLDYWRAHVGTNWVGMASTTIAHGFGSDVVAGDDTTGVLWVLDPVQGVDDNTTTGTTKFTRKVMGGISARGREAIPCNAVEVTCNLGYPLASGAAMTLNTSDDFGYTWTNHGSISITSGDYEQVVEWRSLGLISNPGRIFEITDDGAAVRISGADMR